MQGHDVTRHPVNQVDQAFTEINRQLLFICDLVLNETWDLDVMSSMKKRLQARAQVRPGYVMKSQRQAQQKAAGAALAGS